MKRVALTVGLAALMVALATAVFAQSAVTVTVTSDGAAVADAFVALRGNNGTNGAYAAITDASGVATVSNVADGTYAVKAQAPGTTVGSASLTVSGAATTAAVTVTSSGSVFRELGAYGSGNEGIRADARSGVFYLLNTRAIPSVYRTADYGGHWRPVTLSNDDPSNGLDGSAPMRALTTSGQRGEVAVAGAGKVWFSRDFGTTWRGISAPSGVDLNVFGTPPAYYLYWAHGTSASSASILFLVLRASTTIYWADAKAATPTWTAMGAGSYKTSASDLVTVANGSSTAMFAVLNTTTTSGRPAGSATFFLVDGSPANTDEAGTVNGVMPALATNGQPLDASDAFWIQVGGPATGLPVGTGAVSAQNTILVYSDDATNNADSNATMTVCAGSSCASTSGTTFLTVDDAANPSGKFSGGLPFGSVSTCNANREANAIGSVAPVGATGTVGSCWVTVNGSNLEVRAVANINNNTGMVYDAGYGTGSNLVLISNDGQHGAVKSARMTTSADRVNPNNGFAWNDPGLSRPYFPRFPVIASAGTGGGTGGIAITGLNGAIVRQIVYAPGDATQLAAVMEFTAGGRAIGSIDSGATWFTLYDTGGAAIEWWQGATPGTQWIVEGSAGAGNWLLGRKITSFSSSTTLTAVMSSGNNQPIGPSDFGEVSSVTGNAGVRAIKGIPGTDYAIVATYDGQNHKFHMARFTVANGIPTVTLTELGALTIPETAAPGTPLGNAGAVRMAYCAPSSTPSFVRDVLTIAMAGTDFGQTGLATTLTGIGAAIAANPASPNFSGVTRQDIGSSADFRDVAVNCATGTAWLAGVQPPDAQSQGLPGIARSVNGQPFQLITLPSGTDLRPYQQVVAIDFNKFTPQQVTATNRNGDILRTNDDGATWTILNDSSTASCVNVSGPCGRAFGAEPGDIVMPPSTTSASGGIAFGAAAADASTPGVLGSAAGMYAITTPPVANGPSDPLLVVDVPSPSASLSSNTAFTIAGWAVDRGAGSGTGVDAIHVWAYPAAGAPMFLGVARYGDARADVAAALGSTQFTNSGYILSVPGLTAGDYTLAVFEHSTVTASFSQPQTMTVHVSAPSSQPVTVLDTPRAGATVGQALVIAGWAVDRKAAAGAGVSAVHVWAYPVSNGTLGAPIFLGAATVGIARPDVAGALGSSQFDHAGYQLAVSDSRFAPGTYRIAVYALSTVTGTFNPAPTVDVTLASNPLMAVDLPLEGSTVSGTLTIAGWAVDTAAASGSGIDAVHVWYCSGAGCSAPTGFLGAATLGVSRPDIAVALGNPQFTNSGWIGSVPISGATGPFTLFVYARSTVTGTFSQVRVVHVTAQ